MKPDYKFELNARCVEFSIDSTAYSEVCESIITDSEIEFSVKFPDRKAEIEWIDLPEAPMNYLTWWAFNEVASAVTKGFDGFVCREREDGSHILLMRYFGDDIWQETFDCKLEIDVQSLIADATDEMYNDDSKKHALRALMSFADELKKAALEQYESRERAPVHSYRTGGTQGV